MRLGSRSLRDPSRLSSRDTYAHALLAGLLNTLRVSVLGIVLATILGVAFGVARLSNVWIVATISRGYLEVMRNTPLLLQLLFWYSLSQGLPGPREALSPVPGVFLCFRGLFFPRLSVHAGSPFVAVESPALVGFGFQGGASVSPEFAALLVGLTTYTAAFIGEIVRGGVLAVDRGQSEAAAALGLSRNRDVEARRPAAGVARRHPPHDQPVPQSAEELVARRCHRLPGTDLDYQHHAQPDRPGDRGDCARDGRVSRDQCDRIAGDERVERRRSAARRRRPMTAIDRLFA